MCCARCNKGVAETEHSVTISTAICTGLSTAGGGISAAGGSSRAAGGSSRAAGTAAAAAAAPAAGAPGGRVGPGDAERHPVREPPATAGGGPAARPARGAGGSRREAATAGEDSAGGAGRGGEIDNGYYVPRRAAKRNAVESGGFADARGIEHNIYYQFHCIRIFPIRAATAPGPGAIQPCSRRTPDCGCPIARRTGRRPLITPSAMP